MVAYKIAEGRAYADLDSQLPSSLDGLTAAGLVQCFAEDNSCIAHIIISLHFS